MASNAWTILYGRGTIVVGYLVMILYLWHVFVRRSKVIKRLCTLLLRPGTSSCVAALPSSVWKGGRLPQCWRSIRRSTCDVREWKIRELAMKQRIFLYGHVLGLNLHIAVLLIAGLVSIRTEQIFDSGFQGQEPSSDSISPLVCIALLGLVTEAVPRVLTLRRMDTLHALLMGRLMWQVLGASSVHQLVFWSVRMTACRISVGLWHGNVALTLILNLLYSCVSSWKYASLMKNCAHCRDQFGPICEVWYVMDSCFATLVVTAFVYSMEFRTLKEAWALVQAKISSQAEATVNTLLMALCDAVIRLCDDFNITDGARTLETLLLKTNGSLAATKFLDVLEEADRARFCEHIQDNRKQTDDGPAALLHVHVRDSNGTRVSLQIFTARFTDLNDHVGHLLGILELSREEYGVPGVAHLDNQSLDTNHLRLNEPVSSSPSSTNSSFLPIAKSEDNPDDVTILFDAATLLVLQNTPACTTIAGPSCQGTDLKSWLVDPRGFIEQVKVYCKTLVDLYENGSDDTPILHLQGVKLQPPIARRAQIEYVADVTLSAEEEGVDLNSRLTMRAAFTNIVQQRCKRNREARAHGRQSRRSTQEELHFSESHSTRI